VVHPVTILDHHTLNTKQGVTILPYNVLHKRKDHFISLGKCFFIIVQGSRPLILLKTKDMCTSLTVIGVTKIIFNNGVYVITRKCRVLPVGTFVEGELHLFMNEIDS
jgi:hypothetical protein